MKPYKWKGRRGGMSKYPVISKNGNHYLVDIYEQCGIFGYSWGADVYIRNPKSLTFFNRKKFIKVYNWEKIVRYYEMHVLQSIRYKYITTAIYAVNEYEKSIQDKIDERKFIKTEKDKWCLWDGVIK